MYLVDSSGNQVAAYLYDPFGKVLSSSGTMAEINPLRYRGYYQDNETGFYYLQSRYYDPAICRFINADSYASTGQGLVGYNAFAYCNNNSINCADQSGEVAFWISAVIGAAVNVATTYIAAKATGQDYTLMDGLVAAAAGALNAIPVVGPYIAATVSGAYAGYTAYKNGASTGEIALNFVVSAWATGASISNLADLGRASMTAVLATAAADLTFGLGYNGIAAGTNKAIAIAAENRSVRRNSATNMRNSNRSQRHSPKDRSKQYKIAFLPVSL